MSLEGRRPFQLTCALPGTRPPQYLPMSLRHALARSGSKPIFSDYRQKTMVVSSRWNKSTRRTRWRSSNFSSSRHSSLTLLVFFKTSANIRSAKHWITWALKKRNPSASVFSININELGFLADAMLLDFTRALPSKLFADKSFVFHARLETKGHGIRHRLTKLSVRMCVTYDLMMINTSFASKVHSLFVFMLDQTTNQIVFTASFDILDEKEKRVSQMTSLCNSLSPRRIIESLARMLSSRENPKLDLTWSSAWNFERHLCMLVPGACISFANISFPRKTQEEDDAGKHESVFALLLLSLPDVDMSPNPSCSSVRFQASDQSLVFGCASNASVHCYILEWAKKRKGNHGITLFPRGSIQYLHGIVVGRGNRGTCPLAHRSILESSTSLWANYRNSAGWLGILVAVVGSI